MTKVNDPQNTLIFTEKGVPFSPYFNDIYFDTASGCQQSQSVFIEGNQLTEHLLTAATAHNNASNNKKTLAKSLVIGETGFGTGLNFLLTLQAYKKAESLLAQQNKLLQLPSVKFITTEKYPLSKTQLMQALNLFPELSEFSQALIAQYPEVPKTKTTLYFYQKKLSLTLLLGDASQSFAKLEVDKQGLVDLWYLDGFSPKKNPDMWSEALFTQLARLSKNNASLATFTVAGLVRRGLEKVGFRVKKQQAQGKKSEILIARFQQNPFNGKGYQLRPVITKPQHVSIIGGGIASACAAYSLVQQGIKVTLYCKDEALAQGASSNAIGALYPLLHQQQDEISCFYQHAFWHAKKYYQQLYTQGFHFDHSWCGLLEIAYNTSLIKRQQKFAQLNAWPRQLIHSIDASTASKKAKITLSQGGLFMPEAGWVAPQQLVTQLFNAAQATGRLKIKNAIEVKQLVKQPSAEKTSWHIHTNKGIFKSQVVVLCGGAEAIKLAPLTQLPLSSVRGQVTAVRTKASIEQLATVICHKGYLTPQNQGVHCIGATFTKNSVSTVATNSDDKFNLNMLSQCLPDLAVWQEDDIEFSKARLRCMTPDHLPVVGAIADIKQHQQAYAHLAKDKNWKITTPANYIDNLYVLTGLGARGLCSAPLLADILTADLCNTPYPVDSEQLFNLAPNRFIIRDIIKRKATLL